MLGVLSDTHGQHRRTAAAIRLLQQLGAEAFVHCGDVCGEPVIDAFAQLKAWLITGNCDTYDRNIELYAAALGVEFVATKPLRLEFGGREVLVFHGHEAAFYQLLDAAEQDTEAGPDPPTYVLHGHTHAARDERVGRLRVVNPGALHRANPHTVATVNVATDDVRHWIVSEATDAAPTPYVL